MDKILMSATYCPLFDPFGVYQSLMGEIPKNALAHF